MDGLKVTIINKQKAFKVPTGTRLLIRRCCNAVLTMEEFGKPAEVTVTFVDNEQIRDLNRTHRNVDAETDVLSFPLGENGVYDKNYETGAYMLGDVVISLEKANAQAKLYGHSFRREIGYLTAHSMLHLLGYDHVDEGEDKRLMRRREEEILARPELMGQKQEKQGG